MNTIEQAKQVVELLKDGQAGDCSPIGNRYAAIETINALIAELTSIKGQEPVAWVDVVDRYEGPYNVNGQELLDSGRHNLYRAAGALPAQAQERKPLTDEQIYAIWPYPEGTNSVQTFARAIEAAHGIKEQP